MLIALSLCVVSLTIQLYVTMRRSQIYFGYVFSLSKMTVVARVFSTSQPLPLQSSQMVEAHPGYAVAPLPVQVQHLIKAILSPFALPCCCLLNYSTIRHNARESNLFSENDSRNIIPTKRSTLISPNGNKSRIIEHFVKIEIIPLAKDSATATTIGKLVLYAQFVK